ncbi:hypothetical protein [Streptomyces sp. PU-14G]|uniref:hypothetical protein n=1 Tax=Streptomyces sp. PU-14G TaxID=2800808 RepID=UPI0034DFF293
MAIPGAQPQQPYSQLPTSTAMPAYQFNPYAQPHTPPTGPPGPPSGTPPPRSGAPRWLWALGGVVLASVTWAATLMATGALDRSANEATPDYKGYRYHHDMCATAELKSFQSEYEIQEPSQEQPDGYHSRQKGLDVSRCMPTMIPHGETSKTTPPTAYVTTTVNWHKKTDPGKEFASRVRTWEDQKTATHEFEVSPLKGFGDEAYLVQEKSDHALQSLQLVMRAGWMTYEMRWDWYGGGIGDDYDPPSAASVLRWMKSDTRATLAALKKPDTKEVPGRDPGA